MRGTRAIMVAVVVGALGAATLEAQDIKIGAQASLAQDTDFGIGPRLEVGLGQVLPGLAAVGSFDYFFPDSFELTIPGQDAPFTAEVDYWEINANVIYGFTVADAPGVEPYFGAGLNFSRISGNFSGPGAGEEASETDTGVGINLVGGAKFPLTGVTPFLEARLELKGDDPLGVEDQFVLTGGILIP